MLDKVFFTETNVELDTISVSKDLVHNAQKFIQICSTITQSASFMNEQCESVFSNRLEGYEISTQFPSWFQTHKNNSIAKWIVVFIERAIWL